MILTGCATTEGRVIAAAKTEGETKARIAWPDLPAECRQHMGRVTPKAGEKVRWTQKRWEYAADAIDRQVDDCAAWNDDIKGKMQAL